MTLTEFLNRLGAVRVDGEIVAQCPLCQPHESDPSKYRVRISRGNIRPLLMKCFKCVPPGHWELNWSWLSTLLSGAGLTASDFYDVDPQSVEREWRSVGGRPVPDAALADPNTLHGVYSDLLGTLTLSDRHRKWLSKRGLDPDTAYAIGYRSGSGDGLLPQQGTTDGATVNDAVVCGDGDCLRAVWGSRLDGVPGFVGNRVLLRPGALLHPCRDAHGRILAIKQRLMDNKGSRMRLLAGGGSPKAVSLTHVPLDVGLRKWDCLWVTEGERKADVWWKRTGQAVVGLPGVHSLTTLLPTLCDLMRPGGTVIVALDQDRAGKEATPTIASQLAGAGHRVAVAQWDGAKGLDDAVVAGIGVTSTEWTPPPQTEPFQSATGGSILALERIVPYLRERGPLLRSAIPCRQGDVDKLLARGSVRIVGKGVQGQTVAATT